MTSNQIRRDARALDWAAQLVLDQAEALFEQATAMRSRSREMLARADELDDLAHVEQLANNVVSISKSPKKRRVASG
jgi:hypothetical protein